MRIHNLKAPTHQADGRLLVNFRLSVSVCDRSFSSMSCTFGSSRPLLGSILNHVEFLSDKYRRLPPARTELFPPMQVQNMC